MFENREFGNFAYGFTTKSKKNLILAILFLQQGT